MTSIVLSRACLSLRILNANRIFEYVMGEIGDPKLHPKYEEGVTKQHIVHFATKHKAHGS